MFVSMAVTMLTMPEHERPRERLVSAGPEGLTDRELLALVLRNGAPGSSAVDLASDLIAEHGGLAAVAIALPEELAAARGMGAAKASAVVAAFELGRRLASVPMGTTHLRGVEDVARVACAELAGLRRERVIVLVCDSSNCLRRTVTITEGAIDRSLFPVRDVLNAVLRHDGRAFAIAHNHPSGGVAPSDADRRATDEVAAGARTVGLRFLGHVVVAGDHWEVVS